MAWEARLGLKPESEIVASMRRMVKMAWEARLGLKPSEVVTVTAPTPRQNGLGSPSGIETLSSTTVALVEEEEEASPPGSANQKAAMAGELAKPLRPAPTPQSLALASEPAAE